MPITVPAPNTTGKALFEALMAWRDKDDAADHFTLGVYDHVDIEFSATEATEWVSFFKFIAQVARAGGGAISGINKTGGSLPIGGVSISGYDSVSGLLTFVAADPVANLPAIAFLLAPLANNASGVAYIGGPTGVVSIGFDQTAKTIGSKIYLAAGGGMTFTPDFSQPFVQIVGFTTDQLNPGNMLPLVQAPITSLTTAGGIFLFPEVDLKALATTTLIIPNVKLNPDEVGLCLTTVGGTIVTQPTVEWGITGTNGKYYGPALMTLLTALGKRERFTALGADDAENSLTFTVTVVAAGSAAIKGKPYFRGIAR